MLVPSQEGIETLNTLQNSKLFDRYHHPSIVLSVYQPFNRRATIEKHDNTDNRETPIKLRER